MDAVVLMKIVILLVSALVGLATGPQTIEIQETNNNNQAGGARPLPTVTWRRTVANVPIEVPEKYKVRKLVKKMGRRHFNFSIDIRVTKK